MEDTTIQTISIIGGTVAALLGVIVPILFWMNKKMNQRFDDAQRANDLAHAHVDENIRSLERRVDQRFDDAQKANDLAHAHVDENIRSLERRVDQRFDDAQKTMNQRFDDAQKTMNQRFDDAQKTMNQRFDDAQKANDLAHAHIGENIRSLERRVDNGLANVHTQLAAMTPRAMAAPPDPAPDAGATETRP